MPIINTDIQYRLSGGAANSSAAASLGGAKSTTVVPSALFDDVSGAESAAGDIEYRCFYVHNNHGTLALQNAKLFIQANTPGDRLAVGVGTSAINGTEQTVADEQTAPTGCSRCCRPHCSRCGPSIQPSVSATAQVESRCAGCPLRPCVHLWIPNPRISAWATQKSRCLLCHAPTPQAGRFAAATA